MFNPQEREQLRAELVSAAESDHRIVGAAHLGSAALGQEDRWSDIDLALCLAQDVNFDAVLSDWTKRLYERGAVTHFDVRRGEILYRVFLLENTLQVDISFWRMAEFGAVGPKFKLIFGNAKEHRPAPAPDSRDLIGMGWLYALHVRSSIARHRLLQAEYMLGGMRHETFAMACKRAGLEAVQGRRLDDLPEGFRRHASDCLPRSLEPDELQRAFRVTTKLLLSEVAKVDEALGKRLEQPLTDLVASLVNPELT